MLSLRRVTAAGVYAPPLSGAVRALKYRRVAPLADDLGRMAAAAYAANWGHLIAARGRPETIVAAIPSHGSRVRERGIDHAGLLAAAVARALGVACAENALRRVRPTRPQVGQPIERRRRNVLEAFRAEPAAVVGRLVVLVDDVLTTGSTAEACAETLRAAGAAEVDACVVARALSASMASDRPPRL